MSDDPANRLLADLEGSGEAVTDIQGLTTRERKFLAECVRLRVAFDAAIDDESFAPASGRILLGYLEKARLGEASDD